MKSSHKWKYEQKFWIWKEMIPYIDVVAIECMCAYIFQYFRLKSHSYGIRFVWINVWFYFSVELKLYFEQRK